ncbi:beta-glucosidase family protein [Stackebrandtia soli]|uniref:beta-glucosidase family protein n=1 Tax=Stackebrandtia soli TaxID=1892856 RepID=UPI0039EA9A8B
MNPRPASPVSDEVISAQLTTLTLSDKVRILTGSGPWKLYPLDAIGMRAVAMSDGPAGVRGVRDSSDETSASFPSPTALAATWDRDLASRLGALFAAEARRHDVDVVLAPVVNLHRTPVGGRHFECYSEDPRLTTDIAVTLIETMQRHGVGACVKHFVGNESETARTEYVATMDERTLRELYLMPFEGAVDAGVWMVMAAYNALDFDGEVNSATDHSRLLTGLLKDEWGFDGVVVSDWTAARTTVPSANAGLDLVMPGKGGPWEDALLRAVETGEVDEAVIDDKVRRILRLGHRVGAFDAPPITPPDVDARALLREFAARSTVVIKNDRDALPQAVERLRRVALIGPNAVDTFLQGGGSAHVNPDLVVSPETGLREALGPDRELTVHRGGYARPHSPEIDTDILDGPMIVEFVDVDGSVIASTTADRPNLWLRDIPRATTRARVRATANLTAGTHWLGLGAVGTFTVSVDGAIVARGDHPAGNDVILNSSVNAPPSHGHTVDLDVSRSVEIVTELGVIEAEGWGRFCRMVLRHIPPGPSVEEEIAEAVTAAANAELAVVIVGTNNEVESEGWDRPGLSLPGRQDELVRRVSAANPNTIVIVNAGAPVLLPWLTEVSTVLWSWFPGQECGHAIADILTGRTEPSGRLPWTLPADEADVPVPNAIPVDNIVEYQDGIHIGYRGYLRNDTTPAAPFGHGLGWTDWRYHDVTVTPTEDGGVDLNVTVENVGARAGHEVIQAYLDAEGAQPGRPVRWLAGFTVINAEPGQTVATTVRIRQRDFAVWDTDSADWRVPSGRYGIHVGRSLVDIRLSTSLQR